MRRVFLPLPWWKLEPHDELLTCETPRGKEGKEFNHVVPPAATYWCLAEPGKQYVVYVRGLTASVGLTLDAKFAPPVATLFNPRTGERKDLGAISGRDRFEFQPPDNQDWLVLLSMSGK